MTTPAEPPKIEGSNDKEKDDELKASLEQDMEQVSQMDMDHVLPADATPFSRDIIEDPQATKVVHAEEAATEIVGEAQKATLPKAKKARAEKRKRAAATDLDLAQGTPAPNMIVEFTDLVNARFKEITEQLTDLKKLRGSEAPLQANGIVTSAPRILVEDPVLNSDYELRQIHDHPDIITDGHVHQTRPSSYTPTKPAYSAHLDEAESYSTKFRRALQTTQFNSDEVRHRSQNNPIEMGLTYSSYNSSSDTGKTILF